MKKKLVFKIIFLILVLGIGLVLFLFKDHFQFIDVLSNKELLKAKIQSYGLMAPFFYMFIQMLQVFIAPIPGEATGLVGGYIFGWKMGFIYSSAALGLGSLINFFFARFAGKEVIEKIIPKEYLNKFNHFLEGEGKIIIFALFFFPGFPKDYFCLFLGITRINWVFFLAASFLGRIPGTLLLSLQGEILYHGNYLLIGILAILVGAVSIAMIVFRKKLYVLIEKHNK